MTSLIQKTGSWCVLILGFWLVLLPTAARATYDRVYTTVIGGGTTSFGAWELKVRMNNVLFVSTWDVNGWRRPVYENGAQTVTTTVCYTSKWKRFWGNADGAMITRTVSSPFFKFNGYQWVWLRASLGSPSAFPFPTRDDYVEDGVSIGLLFNAIGETLRFDAESLPLDISFDNYLNEFGGRYDDVADIFNLVAGGIDEEMLMEEPAAELLRQTLLAMGSDFSSLASTLSADGVVLSPDTFDGLLSHTLVLQSLVPAEQQFLITSFDEMAQDLGQMSLLLQNGLESLEEVEGFLNAFSHYNTDAFLTAGDRFSNYIASVPEPTAILLFAVSVSAFACVVRKRRR